MANRLVNFLVMFPTILWTVHMMTRQHQPTFHVLPEQSLKRAQSTQSTRSMSNGYAIHLPLDLMDYGFWNSTQTAARPGAPLNPSHGHSSPVQRPTHTSRGSQPVATPLRHPPNCSHRYLSTHGSCITTSWTLQHHFWTTSRSSKHVGAGLRTDTLKANPLLFFGLRPVLHHQHHRQDRLYGLQHPIPHQRPPHLRYNLFCLDPLWVAMRICRTLACNYPIALWFKNCCAEFVLRFIAPINTYSAPILDSVCRSHLVLGSFRLLIFLPSWMARISTTSSIPRHHWDPNSSWPTFLLLVCWTWSTTCWWRSSSQ